MFSPHCNGLKGAGDEWLPLTAAAEVGLTLAREEAPQLSDDLERGDGNAQVLQEEDPHGLPE